MVQLDEESTKNLNKRIHENSLLRVEIDLLKDAIRNGRSVTNVSAKALELFGLI
nr:MAG TPA: hypothetical protein [Caudoviricetes sp.]